MRMNKLPLAKRTQILAMLCEGSSMRSISRVADVSINTVSKLLVEAGEACLALHDETVRNVKASRILLLGMAERPDFVALDPARLHVAHRIVVDGETGFPGFDKQL